MAPPSRTVKYIVGRALNEVKMQTSYLSASPADYDKAFNAYIDMLIEFEDQEIVTGVPIPDKITDKIGYEIPQNDLAMMLTERIADRFSYSLTTRQGSLATDAFNRLMANQIVPKMKKNPVPNGYVYYDCGNYGNNGCCDIHGNSTCDTDETTGTITTEVGTPILTG